LEEFLRGVYDSLVEHFVKKIESDLGDRIKSVYLCGGMGRGEFTPPKSDIDMNIVLDFTSLDHEIDCLSKLRKIYKDTFKSKATKSVAKHLFISFPDEFWWWLHDPYYHLVWVRKLIYGEDIEKTLPINEEKFNVNCLRDLIWTLSGAEVDICSFNIPLTCFYIRLALWALQNRHVLKNVDAIEAFKELYPEFNGFLSKIQQSITKRRLKDQDVVGMVNDRFLLFRQLDEDLKRKNLEQTLLKRLTREAPLPSKFESGPSTWMDKKEVEFFHDLSAKMKTICNSYFRSALVYQDSWLSDVSLFIIIGDDTPSEIVKELIKEAHDRSTRNVFKDYNISLMTESQTARIIKFLPYSLYKFKTGILLGEDFFGNMQFGDFKHYPVSLFDEWWYPQFLSIRTRYVISDPYERNRWNFSGVIPSISDVLLEILRFSLVLRHNLLAVTSEATLREAKAKLPGIDVEFAEKVYELENRKDSNSLKESMWLNDKLIPKTREYKDFYLECIDKHGFSGDVSLQHYKK